MHASILLVAALGASVHAAPTFPNLNVNAAMPGSIDTVSSYFNMLAEKVQQSRMMSDMPVCDLSKASMALSESRLSLSLSFFFSSFCLFHLMVKGDRH
jgi:hypothetical protein